MSAVRVDPARVGTLFRDLAKAIPEAIHAGTRLAAERESTYLKRKMPVDMGQLKASWAVFDHGPALVEVLNSAPHAGIIERGARPHAVSDQGILAIEEWVRRHFKGQARTVARERVRTWDRLKMGRPPKVGAATDQAIHEIAMAIVWKIRHHGQKATWIVRDSLDKAVHWLRLEVERQLKLATEKVGGGSAGGPALGGIGGVSE